MKLTEFKVLTFDCYGTLIDWESGIFNALAALVKRAGQDDLSRNRLLELYAGEEAAQEVETPAMPYNQLLGVVYKRVARQWGVEVTNEEASIFGASIPDWPAFADSASSLQYLKKFYKLVILSNVDRLSFRSSNAKLGVEFDAIHTAQDIGSYKPSQRNFDYMLTRVRKDFGFEPGDILHIAQSLFHDHAPANKIGLASVWIDRRHADEGWGATPGPPGAPTYDFRFESMAALANAHQEQLRVDCSS
jgi:2-haloalkanoic acid dehalogenase type II